MTSQRRSKLTPLDQAAALVQDGMTIAIGGYWCHNEPSEFARALLRRGVRGLRLTGAPVGGYVHDLLIGTGVADRLLTPHISFDELGLSPSLREAAESGTLHIDECEEACLIGGLKAGLHDLEALPVQSLKLTEVIDHSTIVRPSDGSLAAREAVAVIPDVAILHVPVADCFGNASHLGSPLADRLLARSARRVIVTAERIVDNSEFRADPRLTSILSLWVDAVVEVPNGAYPCSCHGVYPEDTDELRRYIAAAEQKRKGSPAAYDAYVGQILQAATQT